MNKTEEFINKAIEIHEDKYDYSKVEYIKAIEKVIIICKKHEEFLQTPNNHLSGNGCIKCIDRTIWKGNKNDFIKKAIEIHGDNYDYSLFEYINCKTKGTIICKIHGNYQQSSNNHLQGKKYSTDEFIQKAKLIHDDIYDYSKFNYIDNKTKSIIICKNHGNFYQNSASHLIGNGCPKCGVEKTKIKLSSSTEEFIKKAQEIHNNKYDYSKVEYVNSQLKIVIICDKHGEFLQVPSSHLMGTGCYKCSSIYSPSTIEFIQNVIEIHGNIYDYSKVKYKSAKDKIHREFYQEASSHIMGNGCPMCAIVILQKNLFKKHKKYIIINTIIQKLIILILYQK